MPSRLNPAIRSRIDLSNTHNCTGVFAVPSV
jgi:hypothetical protein